MTPVDTHCPYCALQCAMRLEVTDTVTVRGRHFPVNNGGLCQKGWTSASLLTSLSPVWYVLAAGVAGVLIQNLKGAKK